MLPPCSAIRRSFPAVLLAALLCAGLCGRAEAHAVFIFAWPESGRVCTESYYSKSSKVRGGEVLMLDSENAVLATGRTDDAGQICFPAPDIAMDLYFVVRAGQGHRAEYILPAAGVAEARLGKDASQADHVDPPPGSARESGTPEAASSGAVADAEPSRDGASDNLPQVPGGTEPAGPAVSPPADTPEMAALRAMLREELALQLAPLRKAAAGQQAQGDPAFKDIVGGLGWIVGLAALGVLFAGRRRKG